MRIDDKMYGLFSKTAKTVQVEIVQIGIHYTAVTTSNGGTGVCYSYLEDAEDCDAGKGGCCFGEADFEGARASELLELLHSGDPLNRTLAFALVNALNHENALKFPEDQSNQTLFDAFLPKPGVNVAMVGFFKPLMRLFKDRGANLEIVDRKHRMGNIDTFYHKLEKWADVLFLTSTTLLNRTAEDLLNHAHGGVKTVMLGPGTPMVPEAFDHLPVHMLAGVAPLDQAGVLKAVRNGKGTKAINQSCRKCYVDLTGAR